MHPDGPSPLIPPASHPLPPQCCVTPQSLLLQVFRDPVITPSGFSYERAALLEHLSRVGQWDPISRSPMTESDVTPNVGLRNATQHYLDEHPWAWLECV